MKKILIICVTFLLLGAINVSAEEKKDSSIRKLLETAVSPIETILGPATELDKIVVTPSRIEEKLSASSCSISMIGEKEFEAQKIDTVKDALRDQVGLDIVETGAFQGQTSLFTRGADSNKTLIYVDGVKAYDPISPNGAYNLAHLTLDNIDRIEVLRGPQSALYGSDAMAGVINIMSKKAEKPYVRASFEGGQLYTYNEKVEIGSVAHGFHYSVSASRLDTKGISQFEAKNNNRENDPYGRTAVAARIDYDITDKASIGATMRYLEARFEDDNVVSGQSDDDNSVQRDRETFVTLYGDLSVFDWWKHSVKLGWMKMIRQNFDDDPPAFDYQSSKYTGNYFKFDYNSGMNFIDIDNVIVGYEYTEEMGYNYKDYGSGSVYIMPEAFSREGDLYVENRINFQDRLTSTQGIRVTHHSRAGTFTTYRFDGSYLFSTGTKMRGLIATGYKAPSLFQLYSPRDPWMGAGGNPNLQPEKSRSYEYGVDQYIFGDKVILGVTYFHAIYENIIDAVQTGPWFYDDYKNVGKQTAHGVEFSAKIKPIKTLTINSGYTYQKTRNIQNDHELLRRPDNKFFIECYWEAVPKLDLNFKIRYNGPNFDSDLGSRKVKQYTVVDFVAKYQLTKNVSAYGKILNLFNKHYEEVTGFGTLPFTASGGVELKF